MESEPPGEVGHGLPNMAPTDDDQRGVKGERFHEDLDFSPACPGVPLLRVAEGVVDQGCLLVLNGLPGCGDDTRFHLAPADRALDTAVRENDHAGAGASRHGSAMAHDGRHRRRRPACLQFRQPLVDRHLALQQGQHGGEQLLLA